MFGLVGRVIDQHYRIDAVIGQGGFGIVYRGWHLSFDHAVAVKCLKLPMHLPSGAREQVLAQFRTEGATLSRLSEHPSITRVFAFGVVTSSLGADIPYLILEWLEGRTLEEELVARHGLPYTESETLAILGPVVDAIAFAHDERIAHRDLKPANVFLARSRRGNMVKVLDFGIAKVMQEGESATMVGSSTSSGFSAFSPLYGAPEQFRPVKFGQTGPWTDVHAIGLLFTALLSGRPPFEGEDQSDFMLASTSDQRPTPSRRGAHVSARLEAICAKALQLDPRRRYLTARALLEALLEVKGETYIPSVVASVSSDRASTPELPASNTEIAEPLASSFA